MPTSRVNSAIVTPARTGIVLNFTDQSGNPTNLTSLSTNPNLTSQSVNGGEPLTLTNPIWGIANPRSFVYYPLPSGEVIGATDTPTLSVSGSWATTVVGAVDALSAYPINNTTKTTLLPAFVADKKTMAVGMNLVAPLNNPSVPVPIYANIAKSMDRWTGFGGPWDFQVNSNGYLTNLGSYDAVTAYLVFALPNPQNNNVYPCLGPGVYTLKWKDTIGGSIGGHPTVILRSQQGITQVSNPTVLSDDSDGSHVVQYTLTTPQWGVDVSLLCYSATVSNLRVYPPGIATNGSQKYHPQFLQKIAGLKCLRSMDAFITNDSVVVNYSDFADASTPPNDQLTYGATRRGMPPSDFIEICNINRSDAWINIPHQATDALVTSLFTMIAANLDLGRKVHVEYSNETWNTIFGQTSYCQSQGDAYNVGSGATFSIDGLDSNGLVLASVVNGGSDYVAPRMVYFSGGTLRPGGYNAQALTVLGTGAQSGQVVGLNFNFYNGIRGPYVLGQPPTSVIMGGMQRDMWYTLRAKQVYDLAFTAWTLAGRSSSDFLRVLGSQIAYPAGPGYARLYFAKLLGMQVDEFAGSPYLWVTYEPSLGSIYDTLNPDQVMDVAELWYDIDDEIGAINNNTYLFNHDGLSFPQTKFVCYEGGPEYGGMAGSGDRGARSRLVVRHPRMRGIMLHYLQKMQDNGVSLYNHFTFSAPLFSLMGINSSAEWPTYIAWNQRSGLGDGSDGLFDNRTNYEDLSQIVSIIGGAISSWNNLTLDKAAFVFNKNQFNPFSYEGPDSGFMISLNSIAFNQY